MNGTGGTHATRGLAALAAALLVVLAGCGAGVPAGPGGSTTSVPDDGGKAETGTGTGAGAQSGAGTVNFYVSDQRNAIDQFAHLNVTVTAVTLVRAGGEDGGGGDDAADGAEGADDAGNGTVTPTATPTANGTGNATATPASTDSANGTATPADEGNGTATTTATAADEESSEGAGAVGGRMTYQVDNVTVDLTTLQGANATRIDAFAAPNGTYTQVVVSVSAVNGTLVDGTTADVKLPSGRLRLNKPFTVGNGEAVDFVFDITVFERGPNGYILRPVAGESGTGDEVEIRDVGRGNRTAADEDTAGGNGAGNGNGSGKDGNGGGNGNGTGAGADGADERNAVRFASG